MTAELESRTPHFGLRDFLFYLIPGGVVLMGIILMIQISEEHLKCLGDIGGAIIGLFLAYTLGQIIYPLTNILRRGLCPNGHWKKYPHKFAKKHMFAIENHPLYYSTVLFRDRSFARFSLAMVCPMLFIGISFFVFLKSISLHWALFSLILAIISAGAFTLRYRRYEKRYRLGVLMCTKVGWKKDLKEGEIDSEEDDFSTLRIDQID